MAGRTRRNETVPLQEVLERCLQSGSDDEGSEDELGEDEREDEADLLNDLPFIPEQNLFESDDDDDAPAPLNDRDEEEMEVREENADAFDQFDAETAVDESSEEEEDEQENEWVRNLTGFPKIPRFTGTVIVFVSLCVFLLVCV